MYRYACIEDAGKKYFHGPSHGNYLKRYYKELFTRSIHPTNQSVLATVMLGEAEMNHYFAGWLEKQYHKGEGMPAFFRDAMQTSGLWASITPPDPSLPKKP